MSADSMSLEITINGETLNIECSPRNRLATLMASALERTCNTGRPQRDWDLRDHLGRRLATGATVESAGLTSGERLYLTLRVGMGGAAMRNIASIPAAKEPAP